MSTNLVEREIHRPQFSVDDVIERVDARGISLRATRYLFFAGDTINRLRKRDLGYLRWGGIEATTRCIVRGPENYVPRCTLVPMEIGTMQYPKEHIPEGNTIGQPNRQNPHLVDIPCYPGAQILNLLRTQRIKGLVEIGLLQGIEWKTGEAAQIENVFFPPSFKPHVLEKDEPQSAYGGGIMASIERQIESVAANSNSDLQSIAAEMLESCSLYRAWGMHVLDREHNQVKSIKSHDWTHRYSEIGLLLIDELGQSRADQALNSIASMQQQIVGNALNQPGLTPDVLAQILAQNSEQMGQAFAETLARFIPQPAPEAQPEQVEQTDEPEPRRRGRPPGS